MKIHPTAFIHPTAAIHGNVEIGEGSSVWAHAAIRGDFNSIKVGSFTSIQDTCVLHCAPMHALSIGDYVTVGHGAVIHGATVGNCVLVGMRAVLLDGVKVGDGTLIAAGAVVRDGTQIPPDSFVSGNPATVKPAKPGTKDRIRAGAISYHSLSRKYIEGKESISPQEVVEKMRDWKDK